jgi:hypothetical protein
LPGNHDAGPEPAVLPLVLSVLACHRDLIDHAHRLAGRLTAGDFEALVIWCELSRQCGDGVGSALRPVPLHDLVAATAIPRETIRRKLERLAATGQVCRSGRGWVLSPVPLPAPHGVPTAETARHLRDALAASAGAKSRGDGRPAS